MTMEIDGKRIPRHIAVIMDGNGRWAKQRSLKRIEGHRKGAQSVREIVRACREIGVRYLTLFAFSVENWQRPREEVTALMVLLREYLLSELEEMLENGISLRSIGNVEALPPLIRETLAEIEDKTKGNDRMTLTLALSYGGRDEIVTAAREIARRSRAGTLKEEEITKETFSRFLFTAAMPDPDILIRTSGEYRISNFLLWQMAYTELYFTDVLWPDFSREHLLRAIADYQNRERRFGRTSDQLSR
ncbi:MAG TPA: isoprenyl transferase [Syntrophales bacterium]|nr:isoprenyl transferase [Syntrophales bacterium]